MTQKNKHIQNVRSLLTVFGIVFVWRGIWGLMDHYVFPNDPNLSYFISFVIGIVILYIDDFLLDELRERQ